MQRDHRGFAMCSVVDNCCDSRPGSDMHLSFLYALQVLQDCQEMMTDSALVTFIEGVVKQMSAALVKILKGKRFTEWGGMKLRQQVKD